MESKYGNLTIVNCPVVPTLGLSRVYHLTYDFVVAVPRDRPLPQVRTCIFPLTLHTHTYTHAAHSRVPYSILPVSQNSRRDIYVKRLEVTSGVGKTSINKTGTAVGSPRLLFVWQQH